MMTMPTSCEGQTHQLHTHRLEGWCTVSPTATTDTPGAPGAPAHSQFLGLVVWKHGAAPLHFPWNRKRWCSWCTWCEPLILNGSHCTRPSNMLVQLVHMAVFWECAYDR